MDVVEFTANQAEVERRLIHVVWLSSGLGCDGESVAMTGATSPSLEDLVHGVLPGMPAARPLTLISRLPGVASR